MEQIELKIEDKKYKVRIAKTDEERMKGLQDIKELPKDEGMLFIMDETEHVDFWMEDTYIPLDIVFIDEDLEVISVKEGKPLSTDYISEDNVKYVLEVNKGSEIKEGDDVDFDLEEGTELSEMIVLDPKGKEQASLVGGERIFSRPNTKTLIKLAKIAYKSKDDKDYKRLGRKIFEYLKIQDNREPDYVDAPIKKEDN